MNKQTECLLGHLEHGTVVLDGLNECIVGTTCNSLDLEVLVYSVELILETLIDRDGMEAEEALEFFYYNIYGSYLGTTNPVYLHNQINPKEIKCG